MRMFYTFVLTSAVIFHSIECSSQSGATPRRKRHPDSSSSGKRYMPDSTRTEDRPARISSKSPRSKAPPGKILGYSLQELGFLRLIPRTNQSVTFEFRRYIFPAGIPIYWRGDGKHQSPVPATEHTVLSTIDGDIPAILSQSGSLSGIYTKRKSDYPRAKLNMISGAIHELTADELRDCPVGIAKPIFPHNFGKAFSNIDSLRFRWDSNGERTSSSSSASGQHSTELIPTPEESHSRSRSESPPGKAPTDGVLGHTMEQLGYLRLIPCTNLKQRFEFRRYFFPVDEAIQMRIDYVKHSFLPNREYIVLSTSNGDIFAILDDGGTLRGIYTPGGLHTRLRINMVTGGIESMTLDEKRDCPVGKRYPISPKRFINAYADDDSLQFKWNHHGERNLAPLPSSSGRQHSPHRTPLQQPTLDDRSSSPLGRPPTHEVLGYSLAKLGYVRLIPQVNPEQQFEFRRYIFSSAKGIQLMSENDEYVPVPTREHIVLSTSHGDVFAILEYTGILRGIYQVNRAINSNYPRIRINMITGKVTYMTEFEMTECRVGRNHPICPSSFIEVPANQDSLQHLYH